MIKKDIAAHIAVFEQLSYLAEHIELAADKIVFACRNGHCIFACGNGGSASDATHFIAELTGRYCANRRSYAGVCLANDMAAVTAVGNDFGFDFIFSRQLEGLGRAGDVLVAISTSGVSQNVIEAVKVARAKGIYTIGLTGKKGQPLASLVDLAIVVPSDNTARIQEAHGFLLHYFCEGLEPSVVS